MKIKIVKNPDSKLVLTEQQQMYMKTFADKVSLMMRSMGLTELRISLQEEGGKKVEFGYG